MKSYLEKQKNKSSALNREPGSYWRIFSDRSFLQQNRGAFWRGSDKKAGFSLLEVIIAIYILIVGIVGVMTLTVTTTKAGAVSSSRLIAANLAQEGIEVVKNIRDLNYEEPTDCSWACWHAAVSAALGNYLVQYNDSTLRAYANTALLYNSVTGLYSYTSGSVSRYNFKRVINLANTNPANPGTSVKVTSTVTWTENGRSHSLVAETDLWNWR